MTEPKKQAILALDQGTQSSRAMVFDINGKVLASAQQPVALNRIDRHHVEQDASDILSSLRRCIQQVMDDPALSKVDLRSAGLATQRSSVVAWQKGSDQPLSQVLSWQDRRGAKWLKQFDSRAGQIKERTGLRLTPHYGASKLRWLLDNAAPVQQAEKAGELCMGPLAAYLMVGLLKTGTPQIDHANAARTQLWNLNTLQWDPTLLDWFGIPGSVLPTVRPIQFKYGELADVHVPLTAVNGDQTAALYSRGPIPPDTLLVNLGTGAFTLLPTGEERLNHETLLSGVCNSSVRGAHYLLEGTVNGAGAALAWAAHELEISAPRAALSSSLKTVDHPPIFINTIGGLGSPWWQDGPNAAWLTLDGSSAHNASAADKLVAVAESIIFLVQCNIDALLKDGHSFTTIQITGGLANQDGLCQKLADLSVTVINRPPQSEATAKGIAWLSLANQSDWSGKAGTLFSPNKNHALQQRYVAFKQQLERMI